MSCTERKYLRLLTIMVLIVAVLYLILAPERVHLKKAVGNSGNQIVLSISQESSEPKILEIKQAPRTAPNRVAINQSSLNELICCPGIGRKKAELIISERRIKPFFDWRDLQDRIKISAIQTKILKDAGVMLNFAEPTTSDL